MSRRLLLLALALAGASGLAAALLEWPMAEAARRLEPATHGALVPLAAQGRWHDGTLHLACATPGGRLLDCGRYALHLERAGWGLALVAQQPGGGGLRLVADSAGWRGRANEWRLPAAALAAWLPLVEQLQVGGEMRVSGEVQPAGKTALTVRWLGEIGEFPIGEQSARIEGSGERFDLRFGASGAPDPAAAVRLEGGVSCRAGKAANGGAARAARCSGEIIVVSSGNDKRLDQLLGVAGRPIGPGRYRFKVDA